MTNTTQERKAKVAKATAPKNPAKAQKNLTRSQQEKNTRERGSIQVIERTNRIINPVLLTVPPIPAKLLYDAIQEKDREIIRLRRALVATTIRLERTTASLLPRLRGKAKEVRDLRKKLYPENTKGSPVTPARARRLGVTLKGTPGKEKANLLTGSLPPLDEILANNRAAEEREKVRTS